MLTGRRFGATSRMLLPPMAMSPLSGAMNPAIMRSSVVLPQPEGPRIEKKLPRSTEKDKGIDGDVIRETLDDGVGHQIRRAQLAALTRSSTRPSDLLEARRYGRIPMDVLQIVVGEGWRRTAP